MADVEVAPTDLRFRFALNRQLLATINVTNKDPDNKVAFKVKTTAPKRYVVRPSSGVVPAGQATAVQIIMQAQREAPPDLADCKDKVSSSVAAPPSGGGEPGAARQPTRRPAAHRRHQCLLLTPYDCCMQTCVRSSWSK